METGFYATSRQRASSARKDLVAAHDRAAPPQYIVKGYIIVYSDVMQGGTVVNPITDPGNCVYVHGASPAHDANVSTEGQ